jgi:hypothetical protein
MRIVIVTLALAQVLALAGCANTAAIRDWKHTARANCEKEADPILRQTCRERVEAVTATQPRPEDGKRQ